jgi:predicted DNA-binding transcriptional regulator AlpA
VKRGEKGLHWSGPTNEKAYRAKTAASPSPELLSLVQAAEHAFSKLMALFVAYASAERVEPGSASQPHPEWIGEEDVAKMTGMSRAWFQRARDERIGPHWEKIARRVRYLRADVVHWIQSGVAAREHLSSPRSKKSRPKKPSDETEPST